jgi:phosphoribosylaminoimidazole carboxylase PurK protein
MCGKNYSAIKPLMLARAKRLPHNTGMIETVGVIGGGQLGRMLTEAAKPLGFEVIVVDPVEDCPAAQVGAQQIVAPLSDKEAIVELAEASDVLTWEIEHIPAAFLEQLAIDGFRVEPNPATLRVIQDKLAQKRMLMAAQIPVAQSYGLDDVAGHFVADGSYVVKTRRGGFDGRGNLFVNSLRDHRIPGLGAPDELYAEKTVPFDKEVAIIAARDQQGNIAVYPLVETVHKDSICHIAMSPADVSDRTHQYAQEIGYETLRLLEGAGVFAIEMFVVGDNLVVNEIAPRVHNSGHHTIEANVTSQFEQHIRAVTGMPLGSTEQRSPSAVMINILGTRSEDLDREGLDKVLALPDTHPHFYGKSSRPNRKIGHITVLSDSVSEARIIAEQARKELIV